MNSSRSSLLTLGTGTYLHGNPTSRLSLKAYLKAGICLSAQARYIHGTTQPNTLLAGSWSLHKCSFYTTMRPVRLPLQGNARTSLKEVSGPWYRQQQFCAHCLSAT